MSSTGAGASDGKSRFRAYFIEEIGAGVVLIYKFYIQPPLARGRRPADPGHSSTIRGEFGPSRRSRWSIVGRVSAPRQATCHGQLRPTPSLGRRPVLDPRVVDPSLHVVGLTRSGEPIEAATRVRPKGGHRIPAGRPGDVVGGVL